MAITTNGKVSITNLQVGSSADLASIISDESGTGVLAFTTSPTFTTPNLGTPSAVTLTNGTGLPVSGISASTSAAIGVGTIELGHATDTTISRASAGVIAVEGNAVLVSGGALGTPSSGTLTNATGLPVSGISASTSASLGVGSIELGHATDTTISRVSAGVVSIEGVNVVTTSSTDTLSNKTLTAPKFADLGFIADANGNELIILDTVTSAVNEVTLANAATGNAPTITASGGDTNIGITLTPKGSGNVTATALVYTQTLNTPTFSTNAYTLALTDQGDILLASNGSTAGTISIPTNANVAFPTGTQITIVQTGSGQITINAVTSGTTTVNSTGATATAPKLRAQYSSATCVKTATDTWLVIGDIS